jgi:hypothetical protein
MSTGVCDLTEESRADPKVLCLLLLTRTMSHVKAAVRALAKVGRTLDEAVRGRAERAQLIGSRASFSIMDLRTVRRIVWFADDVKAWQTGIKKVA